MYDIEFVLLSVDPDSSKKQDQEDWKYWNADHVEGTGSVRQSVDIYRKSGNSHRINVSVVWGLE